MAKGGNLSIRRGCGESSVLGSCSVANWVACSSSQKEQSPGVQCSAETLAGLEVQIAPVPSPGLPTRQAGRSPTGSQA